MRPKGLTRAERKAWDDVVSEMRWRGIDPARRVALIRDYIKLDARIERLSSREDDPELGNVQISRAINVAVAERRRLHAALFAGDREPELESPPTPAQAREREAYTAWAHFYEGLDDWKDRSKEDRAAREVELTQLYGEPSMRVLVLPRGPAPTRESVQEFYDWMEARTA
jgi:hypothetical protein